MFNENSKSKKNTRLGILINIQYLMINQCRGSDTQYNKQNTRLKLVFCKCHKNSIDMMTIGSLF